MLIALPILNIVKTIKQISMVQGANRKSKALACWNSVKNLTISNKIEIKMLETLTIYLNSHQTQDQTLKGNRWKAQIRILCKTLKNMGVSKFIINN